MGNLFWVAGRRSESVAISRRARAAGEAIGDLGSQITANQNLALTAYAVGDYREAQAFLEKILGLIPPDRVRDRFGRALLPVVNALSTLAPVLAQRGLFDEAVRRGQAALELAAEVGHPYSLACACWRLGDMYTVRGDAAQARPLLSQARSLATELTIGFLSPPVALELSALLVLEGRAKDALSLLAEARAAIEEGGAGWLGVLAELRLGEALLGAGDIDESRAAAARALGLARERGEQGHEAWALRLLGEIATHPRVTAADVAESHYRRAIVLAERLEMRPLSAHCHLGLGDLSRQANAVADAREHLTAAITTYREMAMPFWLAKAEAAIADLR
jgi:tetratricopeptide (TPR) repeat protein